jgi:hypothetical protein
VFYKRLLFFLVCNLIEKLSVSDEWKWTVWIITENRPDESEIKRAKRKGSESFYDHIRYLRMRKKCGEGIKINVES